MNPTECFAQIEQQRHKLDKQQLLKLLEKAAKEISVEKHREDPLLLRIWIELVHLERKTGMGYDRVMERLEYLKRNQIGTKHPALYLAWADIQESYGFPLRARKILEEALEVVESKSRIEQALEKLPRKPLQPLTRSQSDEAPKLSEKTPLRVTQSLSLKSVDREPLRSLEREPLKPVEREPLRSLERETPMRGSALGRAKTLELSEVKQTPVFNHLRGRKIGRLGLGPPARSKKSEQEDTQSSEKSRPLSPALTDSPKQEEMDITTNQSVIAVDHSNVFESTGDKQDWRTFDNIEWQSSDLSNSLSVNQPSASQPTVAVSFNQPPVAATASQPSLPISVNQTAVNPPETVDRQQERLLDRQESDREKKPFFKVNGVEYQRIDLIGKGGSSKVFKVLDASGRVYALKRVKLQKQDPAVVEGYLNEIEILKSLQDSDRIIKLYDSQTDLNGELVMVLEYGEIDLDQLLQRQNNKMSLNFIRNCWEQMLQAVDAIHKQNIIHSDLKPANFLLVEGCLKLIDFGIAKSIPNDTTNIKRDYQTGTVNYMAPEALQFAEQDGPRGTYLKQGRASDVWSLGCILYRFCYGSPPFGNLPMAKKFFAIVSPQYTIQYPDTVTRSLREIMQACLVREPKQRVTIERLLQHPFLHPGSSSDSRAAV
ncbi:kinase-like domain-containing protein [Gorgonomyces haynaldii]|nr:kinase-like domain-containing protein [Gorgonomyces haynaldii]